jgi:HPt (histidine-containing phosphotransfer) domain-containing protein
MDEIMPKPYTKEDVERMAARWLGKEGNAIAASVSDPHAVFDYEGFLDIMAGDAEAARSLIREYLEQTTAHITILEEDVGSGDFDSASKTAHLIKGSSLNITAGKFAQVARRIEKAAGEGDHAGLLSLLEELKREYARLGDVLAKTGAR